VECNGRKNLRHWHFVHIEEENFIYCHSERKMMNEVESFVVEESP